MRRAAGIPRLVSRLYRASSRPLRAQLLNCLLQPLGPLGLLAISSGVFASFVLRKRGAGATLDDAARFSGEQIAELARFVEQVSPDALQQFAGIVSDNPVNVAAFSASAVVLLLRALRPAQGLADAGVDAVEPPSRGSSASSAGTASDR
jgi:hypothetical protein